MNVMLPLLLLLINTIRANKQENNCSIDNLQNIKPHMPHPGDGGSIITVTLLLAIVSSFNETTKPRRGFQFEVITPPVESDRSRNTYT